MVRSTRSGVLGFITLLVAGGMSACATTRGQADGPAASLDVRVLNIVDEHGQTRIRLGAPLPDPQGMKRKYKVHGLQLMTASGQEVGGMGVIDETNSQALCFDTKAGYESLCLGVFNEQPSLYLMVKGKDRISLSVDQDVAKVVVSDAEEKPRVRVTVDKDGKTHVEGVTAPPENR